MSTPILGVPQRMQADRFRFPGMAPREILVFKNWLRANEAEYSIGQAPAVISLPGPQGNPVLLSIPFDYNFRIGNGYDPGPTWPPEQRQNAILNSMKRIDAIAYREFKVNLIEVKDRAMLSAIGQLVSYRQLWQRDFPTTPIEQLILVANRVDPDTIHSAQSNGIRVDIFATDFSSLRSAR